MGDATSIEWTDSTWNVFRGCSRTIAAGAEQSGCGDPSGGGCYAERNGWRFAGDGMAYEGLVRMTPHGARWTGKVLVVDEHLLDPIRWRRGRRIFTTSVSDPFHERFSNEAIAVVFGVMAATPRHIHQMLTKRAARMRDWFTWVERAARDAEAGVGVTPAGYCFVMAQRYVSANRRGAFTDADRKLLSRGDLVEAAISAPWPLPNVMLMTSVENQAAADDRIPDLLATPAVARGISAEPLLGPVDLGGFLGSLATCPACTSGEQPSTGAVEREDCDVCAEPGAATIKLPGLDWVIAGCESGPGARTDDVAWYRSLREQCGKAGVAFFLKQALEHTLDPVTAPDSAPAGVIRFIAAGARYADQVGAGPGSHRKAGGIIGAPYLDGVQHLAFPEVPRG